MILISIIILLASLYPRFFPPIAKQRLKSIADANLLYYMDISALTEEQYSNAVIEKFYVREETIKSIDRQYIQEIVINARRTLEVVQSMGASQYFNG